MIIGRHCTYSLARSKEEQLESFIWNTGSHVVVAAAVNGLSLYLMGHEDLLPGILVGASAGISQNLSHKTAHVLTARRKESCHLPFALEIMIAAVLTYGIAKMLLRVFEYNFGRGDLLKLQSIGMVSIAFYNHSQKPGRG
ncbi:MAG: hypothetical protein KDK96_01340 [Chlamydiia bacterium]|nr:hypothetical protein [Chlamydiia bacterium]